MISEEEKQKMKDFIHMGTGISIDSVESALRDFGLHAYNFEIKNSCGEVPKVTIECFHVNDAQKGSVSKKVTPKNIFKNGLYTTVLWADGTKTIVKRGEDEPDDEYSAFTAALARKIYGTNSAVKRIVRMTKVQSKKHKERKEAVVEMTEQEFKQFGDSLIEKYSENDACPIDKPCEKSTVEHDIDALNEQAKKQYEEYMKQNTNVTNDMWTCPKCGKRYQWQYNAEGRYAFCPHCQLATKTEAKA